MDEPKIMKCRKCGNTVEPEDRYCRECGAAVSGRRTSEAERGFSARYAVYSALITLLFIIIFSFITGFAYALYDHEIFMKPERLIAISILGPAAGIFASAVFTSYMFTLITIAETVSGASAVIVIFKVCDFIIAETFSAGGIGAAAASCAIALAGAWVGDRLKKKFKFSN